jgi:hypothetical protein
MSGPVLTLFDDAFNVVGFNVSTYNGFGGMGVLTITPTADSEVFDSYIGGRLRIKEQFSGVTEAPFPRPGRSELLVPVSRQVKP